MLIVPPITIKEAHPDELGKNGSSNWFGVWVSRYAPLPGAVLAHELYHSAHRMKITGLAMLPAVACAAAAWWMQSVELANAATFALFAAVALPALTHFKQVSEARAKMVECLVGQKYYGWDLNSLILLEAISMLSGHYKQFDGWSREKAIDALRDEMPAALRWVGRERSLIVRWVDRLPDLRA